MKHFIFDWTVATFKLLIVIAAAMFLISISSCSSSRYYARTHDGCQASQGFSGYGNR